MFSCEISEIFRNKYFEEHLRTTSPEETPLLEKIEIWIDLLSEVAFKTTILKNN